MTGSLISALAIGGHGPERRLLQLLRLLAVVCSSASASASPPRAWPPLRCTRSTSVTRARRRAPSTPPASSGAPWAGGARIGRRGVALAAWEGFFDDLPAGNRPAAENLSQSVAGGRTQLVAQTVGPTGGRLAGRAFTDGMQAALWGAAASLLGAAVLMGIGVCGARRVHADPASPSLVHR